MTTELEYLLSYLQDEFRTYPSVRVRLSPVAGTQRAADLEQDYDQESNDLHVRRGVFVIVGGREFFFPVNWVLEKRFSEVQKLAREIQEALH